MKGDSSADIRAARDQARRETEERIDKAIAESGVDNPYTGLPFSGVAEFLAYGRRLQADIRAAEARKAQMEEEASAQTESASERSREERPVGSTASAKPAGKPFVVMIHNCGYPLRFESRSIIDVYNCLYYAIYGNRDREFWDTVFVSLAKLKDGGYFAWQLNSEITVYAIRDRSKPEYAPGDEPGDDYSDNFDNGTEETDE